MKRLLFLFLLTLPVLSLPGQANGKLQLHFINVGQGDAALLISPKGETVLFDEGVRNNCELPCEYLASLGITAIDYMITTHYHDDHIGCTKQILDQFPLQKKAYDRGGSNPSLVFDLYLESVGSKRQRATVNGKVVLDAGSGNEVVITFIAMNGEGLTSTNENDLCLVSAVKFGDLDIMMGGDLSGYSQGSYKDVESRVVPRVSQVEVYKVHHHGSQYSSNTDWLNAIKPKIGVISVSGNVGRKHGHPDEECMERLHAAGIKTYWTDYGDGAQPDPKWDIVGGNIVVEAAPGSTSFTVRYNDTATATYSDWGFSEPTPAAPAGGTYGWSKNSSVYHYIDCSEIRKIKPENLQKGSQPPAGKTLHTGCPK